MKTLRTLLSLLGLLAAVISLNAQDPAATAPIALDKPASVAPVSTSDTPPVPAAGDPWYAPVAPSTAPQTVHQKFMDYAIVTFGPRAIFTPAFSSAIRMARPKKTYPRDWRLGAGAFGRNYGSALASRTSMETGRFLTGALLHEDFRYRPSTSKNPLARGFHAVAFTFIDKSDSGHNRIAFANFAGAGACGFVGNLYLPAGFNNLSHAESRTANAFAGFATRNLLREFAPEILKVTHRVRLPFPRIPVPNWW